MALETNIVDDDPLAELLDKPKLPRSVKPQLPRPVPPPTTSHLPDLLGFVKERGLTPGSTTGGRHNIGSKHYSRNAVDIKGSGGFSNAQTAELKTAAAGRRMLLRDERVRPPGQKEWHGPHLHLEWAGGLQDPLAGLLDRQPQKASTPTVAQPASPSTDPLAELLDRPKVSGVATPQRPSTADRSYLTDVQKRQVLANGDISQAPLMTPKVTSEAKPYDLPELKPLKFEESDPVEDAKRHGVNRLGRQAVALSQNVSMQGMRLPKNHPDLPGKVLTLKFKQPPTADQISEEALRQLGGEDYVDLGNRFKAETGTLLAGNIEASATPKKVGDEYVITPQPTQGLIDAINAYSVGGVEGLKSALSMQAIARSNVAKDINAEIEKGKGVRQDLQKIGAESLLSSAQLAENVKNLALIGGPNYISPTEDPSAKAIAEARSSLPETTTTVGKIAEIPVGIGTTIAQVEAFPFGKVAFPMQQALESAHLGPEEAAKRAMLAVPLVATGPIAKAAGIGRLTSVQRQIATRILAGTGMAEVAGATGASPIEILKSFGLGAAFPIGGREKLEEGQSSPVPRQADVEAIRAFGRRVERVLAAREARVTPEGLTARQIIRDQESAATAETAILPAELSAPGAATKATTAPPAAAETRKGGLPNELAPTLGDGATSTQAAGGAGVPPAIPTAEAEMSLVQLKQFSDPNVNLDKLRQQERPYLDKLKKEISEQGLKRPLQIKIEAGKKPVLWEGSHRLAVLEEIGQDRVPVEFVDRDGKPASPEVLKAQEGVLNDIQNQETGQAASRGAEERQGGRPPAAEVARGGTEEATARTAGAPAAGAARPVGATAEQPQVESVPEAETGATGRGAPIMPQELRDTAGRLDRELAEATTESDRARIKAEISQNHEAIHDAISRAASSVERATAKQSGEEIASALKEGKSVPYSHEALKQVFNLSNKQARAFHVLVQATGIDTNKIQLTKDRTLGEGSLAQVEKILSGSEKVPKFNNLEEVKAFLKTYGERNPVIPEDLHLSTPKGFALAVSLIKEHTIKELAAWAKLGSNYRSFYGEDILERTNPGIQKWAKGRYGRKLTKDELAAVHLFSGLGSGQTEPPVDTGFGLSVFDEYMRTGHASAFTEPDRAVRERPPGKTVKEQVYIDARTGERTFETGYQPEKGRRIAHEPLRDPTQKGQVSRTYAASAVKRFNSLLDHFDGDLGKTIKWLGSKHSWGEFEDIFGKEALRTLASHENLDKNSRNFGVFSLGNLAKQGAYTLNRWHELGVITQDQWVARTMSRFFGKAISDKPWTTSEADVLKRKALKAGWEEAASELGIEPAIIQERMWDLEKQLYGILGHDQAGKYTSQFNIPKGLQTPLRPEMQKGTGESPERLGQSQKAAVTFAEDAKALVHGLENPDFSSAIHEILGHVTRRQLFDRSLTPDQRYGITDADLAAAEKFSGAKDGNWTVKAEERWARAVQRYLRNGEAPSPELRDVFSKVSNWLKDIFQKIQGSEVDIKLTPEIKQVFDKLFTRGEAEEKVTKVATEAYQLTQKNGGVTINLRGGVPSDGISFSPSDESQLPETTSIKNAAVEAAREVRELPGLTPADHKGWEEAGERAREQGLDTADKADSIAEQVIKGTKKLLSDEESAGLRDRLRGIENAFDELGKKTEGETDSDKLADLRADADVLRGRYQLITDATKKAGTEIARALAIRRSAVDQDMLLTQLGAESAYKLATGKVPTPKVEKQIEELVAENKRLKAGVEAHEARRKASKVDKFVREQRLEVRRAGQTRARETLATERADIKEQIAQAWAKMKPKTTTLSMGGLGDLDSEAISELTRGVAKLARNYIEDGIIKTPDVINKIHEFLKDVTELTKRQVTDLLGDYGRIKKTKDDAIEKKFREIQRIARTFSGTADVLEKGIRVRRSGAQRDKPTEDERHALRDLEAVVRKHDAELSKQPRNVETEHATPLDRAHTAARNRQEQLKSWLATGKKEVQGKQQTIPDAELMQIRAENAELEKLVALLSDPATDQRTIERRVVELNKLIAEKRTTAISGNVTPVLKEGAKALWSVEVGKLERERAALNKEISKMRTEQARKVREEAAAQPDAQEEARQEKIRRRLVTIDQRIADLKSGKGRPEVKEGTQSVWSPEISVAERKLAEARRRSVLSTAIADERAGIRSGQVEREISEGATLWTPEIGAMERERATLTRIANDMRATEARKARQAGVNKSTGLYGVEGSWADFEARAKKALAARTRIEKQTADYLRRIKTQDFSTKQRAEPVYDREGNALRAKLEQVKRDFNRLKEKNREATVLDALVRWKRFAVLTYGTTVGKLTSAATGRMAATPFYEGAGQIGKQIMPKTFAEEPTMRGFLKGEVAAIKQLWNGDSLKDFLSHLKGGEDLIGLLYGESGGDEFLKSSSGKTYIPRSMGELMDRPGHLHAALKTVPKRAAFFRHFERGLDAEVNKPNPRDIRDPLVQLAIAGETRAFQESQRAILQQGNPITELFKHVVQGGARSKYRLARILSKALQLEYPITKVPANYGLEVATHIGGLPAGLAEVAVRGIANRVVRPLLRTEAQTRLGETRRLLEQRLPQAIDQLEPAQRQRIARAIKVGGVGLGFVVWGAMRPDQFGGYYQPGERDPNDVKFSGMRFMGIDIPRWMGHIPPLEAAQFGATLRRVAESLLAKQKTKTEAFTEAGKAAVKGLAEEIPFIDTLINPDRSAGSVLSKENVARKYIGGQIRSLIPGAIQQGAKALDYPAGTGITPRLNPFSTVEPVARKPETIGQEVKMGIPFVRGQVPINVEAKHKKDVASYKEQFLSGKATQGDLDKAVKGDTLIESDKQAIIKAKADTKKFSPNQLLFDKSPTLTPNRTSPALDRYERMDETQRAPVKKIMAHKAWALTHSDALTNAQKAEFQKRVKKLGIEPSDPRGREFNLKGPVKPKFKLSFGAP